MGAGEQAVRQPAALPPSRVGTRKDPRSFSDRRQQGARPRQEKGDVQFRKSGVVLPFLSGARAPRPLPLMPPALCFIRLVRHRLENCSGTLSSPFNETRSMVTFYWRKSRWPPPGSAQLGASNSMALPEKGGRATGGLP